MNAVRQFIGQKVMDHTLAFYTRFAFERRGYNGNAKVTLPRAIIPRVPCMLCAFVQNLQCRRLQALCQLLTDTFLHPHRHAIVKTPIQWYVKAFPTFFETEILYPAPQNPIIVRLCPEYS